MSLCSFFGGFLGFIVRTGPDIGKQLDEPFIVYTSTKDKTSFRIVQRDLEKVGKDAKMQFKRPQPDANWFSVMNDVMK
mgnify:CR=1 FL=1